MTRCTGAAPFPDCAAVAAGRPCIFATTLSMNPVPGDFELVEIGCAVAVFAFLPYCQIRDANVTADIFTARASPRWLAAFKSLAALVAACFAAILMWRMSAGMADQRDYGYATTILQLPIWYAFLPILVSLGLLAAAALVTLTDALRVLRGPRHG